MLGRCSVPGRDEAHVDAHAVGTLLVLADAARLVPVWSRYQERLAASSTDSVHLLAVDALHEIPEAAEDLELQAIGEDAAAVASGEADGAL